MPPESEVLSIEYKANFLSPGVGENFLAIGRVIRPGRRIMVCEGDVFAINASGDQKRVVTMLTSMIRQDSKPN
jgi:acyl-coenzyme A thioesterase PaaI-like protein